MVNLMCRGVCTQSPCYCIVMEFCPFGPLFNLLREGKDPWVKKVNSRSVIFGDSAFEIADFSIPKRKT
jgi:hypothetical protein